MEVFYTRRKDISESKANFSFVTGDEGLVQVNIKTLALYVGLSESKVVIPQQCHTANVAIVKDTEIKYEKTDALVGNDKAVVYGVLGADCMPVIIYDPVKKVVAAIHAGWKGLLAGIVENALLKMQQFYGVDLNTVCVYVGPSICGNCYEVGGEIVRQFDSGGYVNYYQPLNTGKYLLDLKAVVKQKLLRVGVSDELLHIDSVCTFQDTGLFSARRNGFSTGRFITGVILR